MNKNIIRIGWLLCLGFVLLLQGCGGKSFDATGYVQAVMALEFQGVTDDARSFDSKVSVDDLKNQYISFVDEITSLLTQDIELSEVQEEEYADVVSQILRSVRYDVGEAKMIEKNTYDVPISVWPTDVLIRYKQLMTQDALVLGEKLDKGEIKGTDEERAEQLKSMIAANASELLLTAYEHCTYGEEQTVHVTLKKENEAYIIDGEEMSQLIVKILRFDEVSE